MNIATPARLIEAARPLDGKVAARHRLDQRHRARHRARVRGAGAAIVLNGFGKPDEIEATTQELIADYRRACLPFGGRHVEGRVDRGDDRRRRSPTYGRLDILVNNAGIQHVAPIQEFPGREVGRDPRDQPVVGVPHHAARAARDAAEQVGPHHQHCLRARPRRLAVQVGLRRGQARHRRADQGPSRSRPPSRASPATRSAPATSTRRWSRRRSTARRRRTASRASR